MAKRESKYKAFEGKRVNEVSSVQVPNSQNYLITKFNGGEKRISSSGRKYYVYKLQLENSVWINVNMFNKYVKRGYFSKQVVKKVQDSKVVKVFDFDNSNLPLVEVVKQHEKQQEPTKYEKTKKVDGRKVFKLKTKSNYNDYDVDMLMEYALKGVSEAQRWFESVTSELHSIDNSITGEQMYYSWQELFERWNTIWCNEFIKNIRSCQRYNEKYEEIQEIATYYTWKTVYESKFAKHFEDNWQLILDNYYKVAQEEYGLKFDETWQLFAQCKTIKEVKALYRKMAKQCHSDLGGSDAQFIELQQTYERALARFC